MPASILVGSREQFDGIADVWTFAWQCPNCCKVQRTEAGRQLCKSCRKGVVVVTPAQEVERVETCKFCDKIPERCFCDSPF